ncbi:MAG: DUF4352 domain-containing protein, partial [Mycolicibacterium sp.]|nr:DUF4352 domain-containing protein [Mycolicibacterium sp.]
MLLAIAASISGCGGLTSATSPSSSASASVGQEVRDGKFAFTVVSVEPPQSTIGDDRPQGQFIVAHLHVKNVGNQEQTFFCSDQKLKDSTGKSYSSSDDAEQALYNATNPKGNGNPLIAEVNPGNAVDIACVYDLPMGTTPAAIELHDSNFSGGV